MKYLIKILIIFIVGGGFKQIALANFHTGHSTEFRRGEKIDLTDRMRKADQRREQRRQERQDRREEQRRQERQDRWEEQRRHREEQQRLEHRQHRKISHPSGLNNQQPSHHEQFLKRQEQRQRREEQQRQEQRRQKKQQRREEQHRKVESKYHKDYLPTEEDYIKFLDDVFNEYSNELDTQFEKRTLLEKLFGMESELINRYKGLRFENRLIKSFSKKVFEKRNELVKSKYYRSKLKEWGATSGVKGYVPYTEQHKRNFFEFLVKDVQQNYSNYTKRSITLSSKAWEKQGRKGVEEYKLDWFISEDIRPDN